MPDAPVYHDPGYVLAYLQLSSHRFFWSPLGILCSLVILPRFWSTRVFTLIFHASAIIVVYTMNFIDTLIWRDHARYIPKYTEISEDCFYI